MLKPLRNGWYVGVGIRREVTAVLEQPLGNRVLAANRAVPREYGGMSALPSPARGSPDSRLGWFPGGAEDRAGGCRAGKSFDVLTGAGAEC